MEKTHHIQKIEKNPLANSLDPKDNYKCTKCGKDYGRLTRQEAEQLNMFGCTN